jgi:hypothetical protein
MAETGRSISNPAISAVEATIQDKAVIAALNSLGEKLVLYADKSLSGHSRTDFVELSGAA